MYEEMYKEKSLCWIGGGGRLHVVLQGVHRILVVLSFWYESNLVLRVLRFFGQQLVIRPSDWTTGIEIIFCCRISAIKQCK